MEFKIVCKNLSSSNGMCGMLNVITQSNKNGHSPTFFTEPK